MSDRSSSTESPLPIIVRRKRARTHVLLGEDYQEVVTEIIEPLPPLDEESDYSIEAVKIRLKYADSTMRNPNRKPSPLHMHALIGYKDACAHLLDWEDGEHFEDLNGKEVKDAELKSQWVSILQNYEQGQFYLKTLKITTSAKAQELQENLIRLKLAIFCARYGDYFAESCKILKARSDKQKGMGWKALGRKYWTVIAQNLEKEKEAWEAVKSGAQRHTECPTHLNIAETCGIVGFDYDNMVSIIQHYAKRNELLHVDLVPMIEEARFHDVAKQLHNDYMQLPVVLPPSETEQLTTFQNLILCIIDSWFIRPADHMNNHQAWTTSSVLFEHQVNLVKIKPLEKEDSLKNITKQVSECYRKRLKNVIALKPREKRVASSQLQAEEDKIKQRKTDFDRIANLSTSTSKLADAYLTTYGEMEPPPHLVPDDNAELASNSD